MTLTEFLMLLLFVTVFVFVPMIFIHCGLRRRSAAQVALQECPNCGAQNRTGNHSCYCCGSAFVPLPLGETVPAVMRQVKQADERRMKRGTEARSAQGVEREPLPVDEAS